MNDGPVQVYVLHLYYLYSDSMKQDSQNASGPVHKCSIVVFNENAENILTRESADSAKTHVYEQQYDAVCVFMHKE